MNERQAIMEAYEKWKDVLFIDDCRGEVCVKIDETQCGWSDTVITVLLCLNDAENMSKFNLLNKKLFLI